jgi:multidrug efflux system membrane fusion protein
VKLLVLLSVIAALAVGGYFLVPRLLAKPAAQGGRAKAPIAVVTSAARKGALDVYLSAPGTVVAFNTVLVRSRVDGELMDVKFKEGDIVEAGTEIALIDARPFEVQKKQAEAQKARDVAERENDQKNLDRFLQAKDEKTGELAISQQQIDTMQATVNQLSATIQADEAQVAAAQLQIDYCTIRAPLTGRLGIRLVDKGNFVRAGDPTTSGLVYITQLKPIAVYFSLPQDNLAQIQSVTRALEEAKKPKKPFPVDVYDRELKQKLAHGELLTWDNQIDQATGTIRMKAVFKNEKDELFPNEFVNARLLLEVRPNRVLVATSAVQRSSTKTYVYVVKGDTVAIRYVVPGDSEADETEIRAGLEAGEVVVIEGVDKLQDGAKVLVPKS